METYHSDVTGCFIWDLQETSQIWTNGTSWICTTEMPWWQATEASLGVSFETCLRRRGDVLIGRHCYILSRRRHNCPIRRCADVPLRHLGNVPSRRRWVFYLRQTCEVAGTYSETLFECCHNLLLLVSKSSKTMILSKFKICKITSILFECHRSIAKSTDSKPCCESQITTH